MRRRKLIHLLRRRLADYPAAALVGPRQCGKTTLARALGGQYFDLEQESARLELNLRWDALQRGNERVIIDEAQTWPEIFPRLRAAIDEDRKRKDRFLLLGSVSPALMTQVSESLAGRLAILELTPFLVNEIPKAATARHWLVGGFPDGGILRSRNFPAWQSNYLSLLVQRDLPAWGMPAKPQVTMRLIQMLAVLQGQMWNASQIGQSLGLSYHSVNTYLDFLTGAFMFRLLPPFHANLKKRLVKTPKIYWRDTGLLHSVLNVADEKTLLTQPWVGASWEGYVIEQILGVFQQMGTAVNAYHLRTSDQVEINLVLDFGKELWAIEIKLSSSPSAQDMDRLNAAADLIGAARRILISQTKSNLKSDRQTSCNVDWFVRNIEDLM